MVTLEVRVHRLVDLTDAQSPGVLEYEVVEVRRRRQFVEALLLDAVEPADPGPLGEVVETDAQQLTAAAQVGPGVLDIDRR